MKNDVNALVESVKNCLAAANDRQDRLEKDLRAFKDYEQLLGEVKEYIASQAHFTEETATNIPALKVLIGGMETKLVSIQV